MSLIIEHMEREKNKTRVVALILGGGKGTRLYPLTKERAKPSVSFGGKYRIVDIPISNCINSGFKKIYLLTQFNSTSLHLHITNSYNFDRFSKGFVEILAAEQTLEHSGWYEGTADSVRKSFGHFEAQNPTHYIILSGDQLYKMDLNAFFEAHIKSGAEVSIATTAVTRKDASGFGIMRIDENGYIKDFVEKPKDEKIMDELKIPEAQRKELPQGKEYLASMGIYIFNANAMEKALDNEFRDFGKEVIPETIKEKKIFAYIFDRYWEDIGTVRSFYEANIALTETHPEFNFYDEDEPVYTHARNLPPSKINKAYMEAVLTSDGCVINDCSIKKSVIGLRAKIESGCELDGVVMMGADFYENEEAKAFNRKHGLPDVGIGRNCRISRTIIDKNAHIGNDVRINVDGNVYENGEHEGFYCADGIIVIRKGAVIKDGTVI